MGIVCKVGFNDGRYPTTVGGRNSAKLKQYSHWKNMLERCYGSQSDRLSPTYRLATISENFRSYSYFYEWSERQVGFNESGWNLDKDLLKKGNKHYSEDFCLFLPTEVNCLLIKSDATRGENPIGVSFDKEKGLFESCLRMHGRKRLLGYFSCPINAHKAYKINKEKYIKEIAMKWKERIDPRGYEALINYSVEITD